MNKPAHKRFHLSTPADGMGKVSTFAEALALAAQEARKRLEPVRIFDRYAHGGRVDLWEVLPGEDFARVLRLKQRQAA